MNHSYESITTAVIGAIEAMARELGDTGICGDSSVRNVAADVYWSWAKLVGEAARQDDINKLIMVISGMAKPSPRFDDRPFRLSHLTFTPRNAGWRTRPIFVHSAKADFGDQDRLYPLSIDRRSRRRERTGRGCDQPERLE